MFPSLAMSKELKEHLRLFSIETIGKRYIEELGLRSGIDAAKRTPGADCGPRSTSRADIVDPQIIQ